MIKSEKLSRLMRLSWDIQKRTENTRSKALQSAWAIINNEDITVHYLTQKLNHFKPLKNYNPNQLGLFKR